MTVHQPEIVFAFLAVAQALDPGHGCFLRFLAGHVALGFLLVVLGEYTGGGVGQFPNHLLFSLQKALLELGDDDREEGQDEEKKGAAAGGDA